jgi:hypothetical protein
MNPRPISVTIVGWIYIVVGIGSIAAHSREINPHHLLETDLVLAFIVNLLGVVAGLFILGGKNWARWLALAWMAFHLVLSRSMIQVAVHALFLIVFAYFLFRRQANAYFAVAKT